jgi:hypothetical protein
VTELVAYRLITPLKDAGFLGIAEWQLSVKLSVKIPENGEK